MTGADNPPGSLILINALKPDHDTEKLTIKFYNNLGVRKKGTYFYLTISKTLLDDMNIWIVSIDDIHYRLKDSAADESLYYLGKHDLKLEDGKFELYGEMLESIEHIDMKFINLLTRLEKAKKVGEENSLLRRIVDKCVNLREIKCTEDYTDSFGNFDGTIKKVNHVQGDSLASKEDPYFTFKKECGKSFVKFMEYLIENYKNFEESNLGEVAKHEEFKDLKEEGAISKAVDLIESIVDDTASDRSKDKKSNVEGFCVNFLSARSEQVKSDPGIIERIKKIVEGGGKKLAYKNRKLLEALVK